MKNVAVRDFEKAEFVHLTMLLKHLFDADR